MQQDTLLSLKLKGCKILLERTTQYENKIQTILAFLEILALNAG